MNNEENKVINKEQNRKKKNWFKHKLFAPYLFFKPLLCFLLLFISIFCCSCTNKDEREDVGLKPKLPLQSFISLKSIKENLYIKKISKNMLSYNGKLNIQRTSYSAIVINDCKFIVIGQGSNIAEIYDVNKRKTVKEIKLKNYYSDDFLYKISDNKILVIGHTIEIIDTDIGITEEIQIPKNTYMFNKGFAFRINDEEIYILLGRDLGPLDTKRTKSFIYNIKSGQIKETAYAKSTESLFLDNVKNMFINIKENTYTAGCSYYVNEIKSGSQISWQYIPQKCSIQKYNNLENKFETIKILEDKFPYYILKWGNNNFIIFYNDKILNYNIVTNALENINFRRMKPFLFRYIADIGENKIIIAGNGTTNLYQLSYLIDIDNNIAFEYDFIDFKHAVYGTHFGRGNVVQVDDKTYFISLFGGRDIYSKTIK